VTDVVLRDRIFIIDFASISRKFPSDPGFFAENEVRFPMAAPKAEEGHRHQEGGGTGVCDFAMSHDCSPPGSFCTSHWCLSDFWQFYQHIHEM
jgi:hypothetical protein